MRETAPVSVSASASASPAGLAAPAGATGVIAVPGLTRVYESFLDPNAESAGLFIWLGTSAAR